MLHFVCDRCGNYWRAYRAKECPACNAARVWEFDRADSAMLHARHVKRGFDSGLFRETRA
jgi:anaerobic ribonucleoside-triphosphate reductase